MKRSTLFGLFLTIIACAATTCAQAQDNHQAIPVITCTDFGDGFVPSYLANGMIGIRPGANPLLQSPTLVGGFVEGQSSEHFEKIASAPYPLETDITIGNLSLLKNPDKVSIQKQTLDMVCGELTTEMTFSPDQDSQLQLKVLQFASRSTPCLLCQEITMIPAKDMIIEVTAAKGGLFQARNKLGVALTRPTSQTFQAKAGEIYTFHTLAAMVSEVYHPEPDLQAIRMTGWAGMLGFDQIRERNRKIWSELWRSRVKVYGDPDAQRALDAAFFYIHSSANPSCITGTAPFGLSSQGYNGHIFWDMDHWVFHAVLPADPEAAKAMLEYRFRGLNNAENVARLFGFQGAQYPWEGGITGAEVTPVWAHTGWAEHHVVLCVALAFWEYAAAVDDPVFNKEKAWPLLRDVAEWIESRGGFTRRGFEIPNIVGADENQAGTSNNAHMNLLAKMVMKAAVRCAEKTGNAAPEIWSRIAASIVIPVDKESGVVVQYDGSVPKPGGERYAPGMTQLLIYHDPMEYGAITPELYKKTYEFEEELRVKLPSHPSNPCSPRAPGFTTPPFAACAAFYGDREKAAELFRHAWEKYWVAPWGITKEYQPYRDGEYLMSHASLLEAAMYGFTGIRIREGDWRKYPASLPAGWEKIEIDRIWIKGKPMKLIARDGEKAQLLPSPDSEDVSDATK
jgi:trehalose/maltose hydrolase-like predicted phosphorylase